MIICPNCGEELPDDARACRACGSDEETGWNPDAEEESLDLPQGYATREDPQAYPEDRPGERSGPSGAFAVFLVLVGTLGLIAIGGARAVANPYAWLAILAIVAGAVLFLRRRARRRT